MKSTVQSLKFLAFLFVCSLGITLFSARMAAQDDGWQIMRADYGFRSQRNDVTDILRDLVSRGGVNGRVAVNNQTMGGDPAVGKDKSLRIFADRKSTRLNSSHVEISYAVFCLKKKRKKKHVK